jgi:hypothetical protein
MLTLIGAQGSGLVRGVHLLVDHCPDCDHGAHHAKCHGCDHECGSAATQAYPAAQQANLAYVVSETGEGPRKHHAPSECPICQVLTGLHGIVTPPMAALVIDLSPRPSIQVPDSLPLSNSLQAHLGPRGPPLL